MRLVIRIGSQFHKSTLRLQLRVAPIINLRTGAAKFMDGFPSTEPVTICSVKYRLFVRMGIVHLGHRFDFAAVQVET